MAISEGSNVSIEISTISEGAYTACHGEIIECRKCMEWPESRAWEGYNKTYIQEQSQGVGAPLKTRGYWSKK